MNVPVHDSDDLQALQRAFAAHLRAPDRVPAPSDVEARRMQVYRDLFYNTIEGVLAGNFPVLKSISSADYWHRLVRGFYANHHSQTPYFLEIGETFIHYVNEERTPDSDDPPFLAELIHYEWVELALDVSELEWSTEGVDPEGDLLAGHPVQSPLAWSLLYRFPVHQIGPDYQPATPDEQPTCLMVYRDRHDRVQFMVINPLTARLLYLLSESPELTGADALRQLAAEMQHPAPDQVVAGGLEILIRLRAADILLGTAR